jgi:hypothetical protein
LLIAVDQGAQIQGIPLMAAVFKGKHGSKITPLEQKLRGGGGKGESSKKKEDSSMFVPSKLMDV